MERLPAPFARVMRVHAENAHLPIRSPERTKRTKDTIGTIYFIMRDGRRSLVKIGWSLWPEERRERLQTSCPETLFIVHQLPGTVADERALHHRFASLRVRGEWFRLKGELAVLVGLPQYK